jgi:hypothetical protein
VAGEVRELIESNARLWAGEAEVVRSYFASRRRSRATDLQWIARQAFKEYWEGFAGGFEQLQRDVAAARSATELLESAELLHSELAHYCIFAELHEALRGPGDAPLDPQTLRRDGDWPENRALRELRDAHVERHGALGRRARRFTEGGYATLFSEGMRLLGRGGADDRIAAACARIHADETQHMLGGLAGAEAEGLGAADWAVLARLSAEQMRARIHMRNAQFGRPLEPARVAALCAGACEPLPHALARFAALPL